MRRFIIAYMWIFSLENNIFECYAKDPTDALQQLFSELFDEFTDIENFGQLFDYCTEKNIAISYPFEIVERD